MGKHIGILNKVELVGQMWFSEITPVTLEYENVDEKLHQFYEHIGCDLVDVAYIEIEGKPYTMFFDEEGKIKGPWHPTYPLRYKDEILDVIAGSVLIVKEDENENILDLTDEEKIAISVHLEKEMMAARHKVDEILAERRANHG